VEISLLTWIFLQKKNAKQESADIRINELLVPPLTLSPNLAPFPPSLFPPFLLPPKEKKKRKEKSYLKLRRSKTDRRRRISPESPLTTSYP